MGITKRKLASNLGVTEDTLYRWIKNGRPGNITLHHFQTICQLLDEKIDVTDYVVETIEQVAR